MWLCPEQGPANGGRAAPIRHLALAHAMMAARVAECGIINGLARVAGVGRAECLS